MNLPSSDKAALLFGVGFVSGTVAYAGVRKIYEMGGIEKVLDALFPRTKGVKLFVHVALPIMFPPLGVLLWNPRLLSE